MIKSSKSILVVFILSGSFLSAQPFGGGNGSQYNPYKIYSREHLEELADSVLFCKSTKEKNWSYGKYFILMNDIRDSVRRVIGCFVPPDPSDRKVHFEGNFDGQGYKITLALYQTKEYDLTKTVSPFFGLFGVVSGNVEIKNVIVDGYIKATDANAVGSIMAYYTNFYANDTNYYKCKFTIKNCINMANISATKTSKYLFFHVAGILGLIENDFDTIIIEDCINIGTIEGIRTGSTRQSYVSGIYNIYFDNCKERKFNDLIYTQVFVNNCMNVGYIKSSHYAAGISAGFLLYGFDFKNSSCSMTNCINTGVIVGEPGKTGGIISIEK